MSKVAHAVGHAASSIGKGLVNTAAAPFRVASDAIQGKNVIDSIKTNGGRAIAGTLAPSLEVTRLVAAPLKGTIADSLTGNAFTGAVRASDDFRESQNTGQISTAQVENLGVSYGTVAALGYGATKAYGAVKALTAADLGKAASDEALSLAKDRMNRMQDAADGMPDTPDPNGLPLITTGDGMTPGSPRPLKPLSHAPAAAAAGGSDNSLLIAATVAAAVLL